MLSSQTFKVDKSKVASFFFFIYDHLDQDKAVSTLDINTICFYETAMLVKYPDIYAFGLIPASML